MLHNLFDALLAQPLLTIIVAAACNHGQFTEVYLFDFDASVGLERYLRWHLLRRFLEDVTVGRVVHHNDTFWHGHGLVLVHYYFAVHCVLERGGGDWV